MDSAELDPLDEWGSTLRFLPCKRLDPVVQAIDIAFTLEGRRLASFQIHDHATSPPEDDMIAMIRMPSITYLCDCIQGTADICNLILDRRRLARVQTTSSFCSPRFGIVSSLADMNSSPRLDPSLSAIG